jgi:hypothetical protein
MRIILVLGALVTVSPLVFAQDYRPFIPVCVVDGGEFRQGLTMKYVYEGTNYVVGFCSIGCRTKFLQSPATYMAQTLAARASMPAKKDKEKKPSPTATGPCDQKKLVKVPWCVSCSREIGKDDLRNGLCKRCETKATNVEFCVKAGETYYQAEGHPETRSEKPFTFEGKLISVPRTDEDRARITYLCESCMATAEVESELKHQEGCKPKIGGLKKVCAKSGTSPHATEAKK